ncbi:MAG: hypothetical protein KGJ06_07455 [Pseudomonadota bacterium]|nr:hypothetical protein [Pseudomonadota bacterium]
MPAAARTAPYLVILAVYAASRLVFAQAGVSFTYQQEITTYLQYLDVEQLRHHLLYSLFYLHSQPPLFNLLLGLSFKLFGDHWHTAMHFLFLLLGLVTNVALFRVMRLLGIGAIAALCVTCVYMISPSQILYENLLFYPYAVAALITIGAWCIAELACRRNRRWGHALAWTVAALCLLQGSFHPLLLALPFCAAGYVLGWRAAAKIISLPALLVLAWYAKNVALFDVYSGSSWMGMNWSRVAINSLFNSQREQLFEQTHDPLARIPAFLPPEKYQPFVALPPIGDIPVLSEAYKTGGAPNYNNALYILVSKRYAKLSWEAIRLFPDNYLHNVLVALCLAAAPSERYNYIGDNIHRIAGYADWYDMLVWLSPYPFLPARNSYGPAYIMGLTPLFLFPVGLMLCWLRCLQSGYWRTSPPRFWALLYMTALPLYSLVVHSLFEIAENNRFRFDWEPLLVAVIALALFQRRPGSPRENA